MGLVIYSGTAQNSDSLGASVTFISFFIFHLESVLLRLGNTV